MTPPARFIFNGCLALFGLSLSVLHAQTSEEERTSILLVTGAPGNEQFSATFSQWAESWKRVAESAHAQLLSIGLDSAVSNDRLALENALNAQSKNSSAPLWIVLLGHGTSDGTDPKFNLRGDDLSSATLAQWIAPFQRPIVFIGAFSTSGAFLKPLSAPNRFLLTATKNATEQNFSRFGGAFAKALLDPISDLDKDGQTSLLEAWLFASQQVAQFYKTEGRIASEHSLLDDNGDSFGTPADWFEGLHRIRKSNDSHAPDGVRAHQIHLIASAEERALPVAIRQQRNALELQVVELRELKSTLREEDYYQKLEVLLLQIARLYKTPAATPAQ